MNFHILQDGQPVGPFSTEDIKAKLAANEVTPQDLCWGEGMPEWQAISSVPDLVGQAIPPPIPVPTKDLSAASPLATTSTILGRPQVQCLDCGHVGPAVKKEYSKGLAVAEFIWGAVLFLACIIPCFIYIAIVASKRRRLAELRYCEKCGSSAIKPVP